MLGRVRRYRSVGGCGDDGGVDAGGTGARGGTNRESKSKALLRLVLIRVWITRMVC